MSSEKQRYTMNCPNCNAPCYFTGFGADVNEEGDIVPILFPVCSGLCDGGEDLDPLHLTKDVLENIVSHGIEEEKEQFTQMMNEGGFPDPESTDGG